MSREGRVRLRQAVLVAASLAPVESRLRSSLGLGEPFHDPGVGLFGLANAVFAIGDRFIEVVSPREAGTAAGRHLERHGGDGGYMVMFDVEDIAGARERAARLGVRTVWEIDLPDISGTHLHPRDMRGAIVSIDSSRPFGSWRWGGPEWTGTVGPGAPGRLAGVTLSVDEPALVAERWGAVLGVPVVGGEEPLLELEDTHVRFRAAAAGEPEPGLVEVAVELPRERAGAAAGLRIGSLAFDVAEQPAAAAEPRP